jgi:hypothetical protein
MQDNMLLVLVDSGELWITSGREPRGKGAKREGSKAGGKTVRLAGRQ